PVELPRIEIELPSLRDVDVIDMTLAEYAAEIAETAPSSPFVVATEESAEWVPPVLPRSRRAMRANSDFTTASRARSIRASKQRCPQCKGGLKANVALPLHLARGGAVRDISGKRQ